MKNKILRFIIRLPAIKLIGIKENKEFIKKASKFIFFDEITILIILNIIYITSI